MGVDFIRRAARSFHKGLDRRRIELATPTLFTRQPATRPRRYAARVCDGERVTAGEALGIRLDAGTVYALRGISPVATIENPPPALLEALVACDGEAACIVEAVHEIAQVAEMTIC